MEFDEDLISNPEKEYFCETHEDKLFSERKVGRPSKKKQLKE